MRVSSSFAALATTAALAVTPAVALASAHKSPAPPKAPVHVVRPTARQVKFFGKYCKTENRKLARGQKVSDFGTCVLAMVKVAKTETTPNANLTNAEINKLEHTACKAESKKAEARKKASPFIQCVQGARKLTADEESSQGGLGY